MVPRFHDSMMPRFHDSMMPCFHNALIPWFYDAMFPCFHDSMIPCLHGTMILRCQVSIFPWFYDSMMMPLFHDSMILWFHNATIPCSHRTHPFETDDGVTGNGEPSNMASEMFSNDWGLLFFLLFKVIICICPEVHYLPLYSQINYRKLECLCYLFAIWGRIRGVMS